jgi:hypothetical protein
VPRCLWGLEHDINPVLNSPHHRRSCFRRDIDAPFLTVAPPMLGKELRQEGNAYRIVCVRAFQQSREEGIAARCADRISYSTIFIALGLMLRTTPSVSIAQVRFVQCEEPIDKHPNRLWADNSKSSMCNRLRRRRIERCVHNGTFIHDGRVFEKFVRAVGQLQPSRDAAQKPFLNWKGTCLINPLQARSRVIISDGKAIRASASH